MSTLQCRTCGASFEGDARRRYCSKHTPPKRVRNKARPQHLHAIEPGETPPQLRSFKTIEEAAEAGDTLAELRLMRARIARTLDDPNCPPKDISSLSRRQLEIGREIAAIEARAQQEDDPVAKVEDGKFDATAI